MARAAVVGVMGAGDNARSEDVAAALALGEAIAKEGWILLSGGRNSGIMDAVNKGAKRGGGFTIGIVPGNDKSSMSEAVDVGIVSGMGSARNYLNVLSSDVIVACGYGGAGTASEIALALKAKKPVVLYNDRCESRTFFVAIGAGLVYCTDSLEGTVETIRKLLKVKDV